MKTIVIGGVPRAGKSQLAHKLWQQTKATVFHADHLTHVLANNFPQSFSRDQSNASYTDLENVLVKLIRNMGKEFDYVRIFESSILTPSTVAKKFQPREKYLTLYLGYPMADPAKKLDQIRTFAQTYPHCWSHGLSDKKLRQSIQEFIELSLLLQGQCNHHHIPFVDVSTDIAEKLHTAQAMILSKI